MKLRVATVQEHFCSPLWQLSQTPWGKEHIELIWNNSGTGQMIGNISGGKDRSVDVVVALTEALIAGIAKKGKQGGEYKLVGSYVRSPLNWAVITGTDAKADRYQSIADLKGQPIGISRQGSGSQTMACYMAMLQGWDSRKDISFKVLDTFEGLRDGVNQKPAGNEAAAFMWEYVTTLPFVHSGEVRYIGNVPTPWPSWSIAANTEILDGSAHESALDEFLQKLREAVDQFLQPEAIEKELPHKFVVDNFGYKREDVDTWFNAVRYAGDHRPNPATGAASTGQKTDTTTVSKETLQTTLDILGKAGAIEAQSEWDLPLFAREKSLVA